MKNKNWYISIIFICVTLIILFSTDLNINNILTLGLDIFKFIFKIFLVIINLLTVTSIINTYQSTKIGAVIISLLVSIVLLSWSCYCVFYCISNSNSILELDWLYVSSLWSFVIGGFYAVKIMRLGK